MDTNPMLIVIGRQFGSGGREIARKLSKRLGISAYDKKLLDSVAEHYGFSKGIFSHADEKKPSLIRSLLSHSYGIPGTFNVDALSPERLYELQSSVIRNICDKESCIIVGRTADYVMRHHPKMLSVFIHAPAEHRAARIMKRGDAASLSEGIAIVNRHDRDRQKYYNYFTGRNWGHADNYNISLDSSLFSDDDIVEIISTIISQKNYLI